MFEQLKKLIKRIMPDIDVDTVTEETRLIEELQFDSLAMMMLAMAMEDEFNVKFDGPVNFVTVADVLKYLQEHK